MKTRKKHIYQLAIHITMVMLLGLTACGWNANAKADGYDIIGVQYKVRYQENSKASDAGFLAASDQINRHLIALGKLGNKKSKSAEVRSLSVMLTEEHTAASGEIKLITKLKKISIPETESNLTDEWANTLGNELNEPFDTNYLAILIKYHKSSIAKFEIAKSATADDEIKEYISAVLPALYKHLEQAQGIQKNITMNKN